GGRGRRSRRTPVPGPPSPGGAPRGARPGPRAPRPCERRMAAWAIPPQPANRSVYGRPRPTDSPPGRGARAWPTGGRDESAAAGRPYSGRRAGSFEEESMTQRFIAPLAFALALGLATAGAALAGGGNPSGTGQPNQSCQTTGTTPGNAVSAPGSAFNPGGQAGSVYA